MSAIKIIGGLLLALGVLLSHGNAYAITGLQGTGECPATLVQNRSELIDALKNLSPETLPASKYYQADKSRFVFCIDPDAKFDKYTFIQQATILTNATAYPVIIYGLTVDSGLAAVGQTLLTVNGPILLQNISAPILRGPIAMNGTASIQGSVLACDTTAGNIYANAILELKGQSGGVNTVAILNCQFGINVTGTRYIVTDVKVIYDKALVGSIDDGLMGVSLGASNILKASSLGKTIISGYTTAIEMKSSASEISRSRAINVLSNGAVKMNDFAELSGSSIAGTIHVNGNNVLVGSKDTLGGDPAIQIAKGMTGVKVTQNTFTKVNTITYMDADDAKAHTLLSAEWMGKKVSETDANYATRVVGKLLNQTNTSQIVEMNKALLKDAGQGSWLSYNYDHTCTVAPAAEDIPITLKSNETNIIKKGELYFDCAFEADGSTPLNIPLTAKARFISNLPEISTMSEDVTVADLGGVITIVAIAESTVTNGGENSPEAPSNPTGDDDPKIPDPTDTGENANGSAQGNGATSDGFALAGETPSGYTAGASPLGSCTLSTVGADQGQTASALIWVLALLPLPLIIPFRNSKKDDE